MGFNITIGELERPKVRDGYYSAKKVRLENAPADGVPTDYTNQRWPSYTAWGDFCEAIDINERLMINDHPGFMPVNFILQQAVDKAYAKIKSLPEEHQPRLEWLKFWVDWAMKNCKVPAIVNT